MLVGDGEGVEIIAALEFHRKEMSETRRWLVRTREMERRELEDKKGVKRIEENYKQLEEEYSKLRESNRQLVAIAKGLAGALLVVGGVVVVSRLWSGGGSGGLTTHTVGVNIVTGEKLIQDFIGRGTH